MKSNPCTIEAIQDMWTKDSVMNQDELDNESLRIPQLHAKYYDLYNTILLMRKRDEQQYSSILLDRRKYYTGKATADIYAEEPFPYKVREKDAIQRHMDADEKLIKVDLKIRYYDATLKFLEEIIRVVNNRTYQIKNAIEWNRFQAGM